MWRCFFLEFVICINIRFFFCVQLDPSFDILCVQKKNECVPGRNDALWIHLWKCFFDSNWSEKSKSKLGFLKSFHVGLILDNNAYIFSMLYNSLSKWSSKNRLKLNYSVQNTQPLFFILMNNNRVLCFFFNLFFKRRQQNNENNNGQVLCSCSQGNDIVCKWDMQWAWLYFSYKLLTCLFLQPQEFWQNPQIFLACSIGAIHNKVRTLVRKDCDAIAINFCIVQSNFF